MISCDRQLLLQKAFSPLQKKKTHRHRPARSIT